MNFDREKIIKIIGIVVVIGVIVILFNMYFGKEGQADKGEVEQITETAGEVAGSNSSEVSLDTPNIQVEKSDVADKSKEDDTELMEETEHGPTEPDFGTEYVEKYGNEKVDAAIGAVGKTMALYLLDETEADEWKPYASKGFYEKKIKEAEKSQDGKKREIRSIEVVPTEPTKDNEMRFVVFAFWDLHENGKTINTQNKMFYVNVVQSDGKWLVNEIEGIEQAFDK